MTDLQSKEILTKYFSSENNFNSIVSSFDMIKKLFEKKNYELTEDEVAYAIVFSDRVKAACLFLTGNTNEEIMLKRAKYESMQQELEQDLFPKLTIIINEQE